MSGNSEAGKRAARTIRERYGRDYYSRIGQKGGKKTQSEGAKPKGFAAMDRKRLLEVSSKGGKNGTKSS